MRIFKALSLLLIITAVFMLSSNKKYHNIGKTGDPDFLGLLKWQFTREKPVWPQLPTIKPKTANPNIAKQVNGDEMAVTYINHSTILIQMDGENILTDPIWSTHAGPFGKFGVKRSIYPGLAMEDLPEIDFILISHSHYDHLDLPSLEALTKKHQPRIITGLGVTRYIDYCQEKPERCHELEWWGAIKIADSAVTFNFVPAYHWSSRYFLIKIPRFGAALLFKTLKKTISILLEILVFQMAKYLKALKSDMASFV